MVEFDCSHLLCEHRVNAAEELPPKLPPQVRQQQRICLKYACRACTHTKPLMRAIMLTCFVGMFAAWEVGEAEGAGAVSGTPTAGAWFTLGAADTPAAAASAASP